MLSLLTIGGGVALLLFAVRYLRKGLDRILGTRLGRCMQRLGGTPFRAFIGGLGSSVVAPSSTTMSLLAVDAVQSGHLSSRQTLVVMLGANIGLTLTVQLIALRVEAIAPILILLGVILFQFTRRSKSRGIGQILLGLGFLFLAIGIMRSTVRDADLGSNADFQRLVDLAGSYPVLVALLATLLAVVLQSSTATIAVLIGVSSTGLITAPVAIAVVLGANVGMTFTTLLVGWKQVESQRLAVANLLLKAALGAVIMLILELASDALPQPRAESVPVWIAQAHSGFNILVAIVGLPLVGTIMRGLEQLLPAPTGSTARPFGPRHIGTSPIDGMALALGQSLREIMHVSEIVRGMLIDVWTAMQTDDERLAGEVSERDDQVDLLEAAIKRFLTRLVQEESDQYDADEQMLQLRYVSELETVGDIIDKNLSELALKKIRTRASFSEEGAAELEDFFRKVLENFDIADTAFTTRDRGLAVQLIRHKERLMRYDAELRERHFSRLNAGLTESHETSAIHLDVLTHLKRINSCLSHVGYAIVQESSD